MKKLNLFSIVLFCLFFTSCGGSSKDGNSAVQNPSLNAGNSYFCNYRVVQNNAKMCFQINPNYSLAGNLQDVCQNFSAEGMILDSSGTGLCSRVDAISETCVAQQTEGDTVVYFYEPQFNETIAKLVCDSAGYPFEWTSSDDSGSIFSAYADVKSVDENSDELTELISNILQEISLK